MEKTFEALFKGYQLDKDGNFIFKFGNNYELVFEPLLFNDQFYVALYQDEQLLTNKVVIKPGKE